jgi:hypothetical protein
VLNRLAAARMEADAGSDGALPGMGRRVPRAFVSLAGFAAAGLMCAVMVVGSVNHSRRYAPRQAPAPPTIPLAGTGVGAASAEHPGAPASAPVPAGPSARGHASQRGNHGRARIEPQARKAPGVAVPDPASRTPQN